MQREYVLAWACPGNGSPSPVPRPRLGQPTPIRHSIEPPNIRQPSKIRDVKLGNASRPVGSVLNLADSCLSADRSLSMHGLTFWGSTRVPETTISSLARLPGPTIHATFGIRSRAVGCVVPLRYQLFCVALSLNFRHIAASRRWVETGQSLPMHSAPVSHQVRIDLKADASRKYRNGKTVAISLASFALTVAARFAADFWQCLSLNFEGLKSQNIFALSPDAGLFPQVARFKCASGTLLCG